MAIRFLLGDEERRLDEVDPNLTVLRWLREQEGLCGSKEGCAEGDCGACTVVLVEADGDRLRHRAVNACIQFLPTLHGKQLLTVEHLQGPDGALHPAQQAMVDCHASQCGFCTPGFVMSLYALYRGPLPDRRPTPDRQEIDDALAGNLCRCTGYGPIVAAARRMHDLPASANGRLSDAAVLAKLQAIDGEAALSAAGRRYFAPRRVDALAETLLRYPTATVLAGGTDVGLWVTKQHRSLDPIVYLGDVAELKAIRRIDDRLEIGAGVTYSDAFAAIAADWPDFAEVLRRLGSRQIRNAGTLGGNIANGSPIGDSPPPLIALGATLTLRRGAERRSLPLEDFFLDYGKQDRRPGEFVESIVVPRRAGAGAHLRCYKISKRFDQDISAVLGAFRLRLVDGHLAEARIAYGGMAATPKRARACEQAITGRPWTAETVAAGCAALTRDFAPIDDMRASAAYRMRVAQNLLRKAHVETTQPEAPTRLVGAGALAHV